MNPTYFIEQFVYSDGHVVSLSPIKIQYLDWQLQISKKFNVNTIAIFKIYPHLKPAIAHYDNDLNAVIIE